LKLTSGMPASAVVATLKSHILAAYEIEIAFVDGALLSGSRGEVSPEEGLLYVDKKLERSPEDALEVIAHECGHLVLHHRFFGPSSSDLIRGSVFLDQGAAALSRYSPRSQEEAEASAFASELIAPASDVFAIWRQDASITVEQLAQTFSCTPYLVQIQLAEGLYHHVIGEERPVKTAQHPPTSEQEDAAAATGRPVLVDAGPGTGKTKTLIRRVEHLIGDKHVPPEQILILTFSNEAAAELRERLESSLGETSAKLLASTFHGFGVLLLHAVGDRVGLDVDYSIMDETAQIEAVSEILGRVNCDAILNLRNLSESAAAIAAKISYLKDRLLGPEDLRRALEAWRLVSAEAEVVSRCEALLRVFVLYEEANRQQNRVDFADLIVLPYRLLCDHADIRERLRHDFKWVLVDEYQDVSRATALLLQQVTGPDTPPWVVGDARQAIYRFRGAEPGNVTRFADDFPNAVTFRLRDNYRSASEIVETINHLAGLLENPDGNPLTSDYWRARREIQAVGTSVRRASANSDLAEREGVEAVVEKWVASGVPEEDIAVLARRNIDVRNIAVAINRRGIRATTTGILTAEGAAGDLAAVISAVDQPLAIARVAYALNPHASPNVLNGAVGVLISTDTNNVSSTAVESAAAEIIAETGGVRNWLSSILHSADGWTVITGFLFFKTPYLRRFLSQADAGMEAAVDLDEVLSTLALAAGYRFTHRHESPRRSRLGFAERLRQVLTSPAPGLLPPRKQKCAVRVMTCHAAKGLEFPCVVVAGQSVPQFPAKQEWLPPALRPEEDADLLQADALLFVGVSRAERAVVVSHARSASGSERKPRLLPKLLQAWLQRVPLPIEQWEVPTPADIQISVPRVWGGNAPEAVTMYALGAETCRLRTYVQDHLGIRFYTRDRPLYPEFIRCVYATLSRVVSRQLETGQRVTQAEVQQISNEMWPPDAFSDHPHIAIYRPRVGRWAEQFAEALAQFDVNEVVGESVVWTTHAGTSAELRLQVVTRFRQASGEQVVVALKTKGADPSGRVLWSKLDDYRRLPFVLLQERDGDVRPMVFFAEDGQLQQFLWRKNAPSDAIARETERATSCFRNVVEGEFDARVDDWTCDRCSARIVCPWRIGAAGPADNLE
jgi:ATP-dependent DNA helicase UvrD/PcrA